MTRMFLKTFDSDLESPDLIVSLKKMVNIFAYTSPNRSGVGAIYNPDRFEQVFDTYHIPEAPEKIFMDDISMVHP